MVTCHDMWDAVSQFDVQWHVARQQFQHRECSFYYSVKKLEANLSWHMQKCELFIKYE